MAVSRQSDVSWMDRSLQSAVPITRESIAWAGLVAATVASRFFDLGARAMGHDESLHAIFSFRLLQSGAYRHDPTYHGPLLYHVNAAVYWLLGASDTTARLVPGVAGVGVVAAMLMFRRYVGHAGAWLAGCLAAISPTLLFYGRYLREDIYVAFLALVWVHAAFRYLDDRRARWLAVVTVAAALSFLVKESTFIFGPIVGAFFLARFVASWTQGRAAWGASADGDLAVLQLSLALPFAAPLGFYVMGVNPAHYSSDEALRGAAVVVPVLFATSALLAWAWSRSRRSDATAPVALSFPTWARLMALFWILEAVFFTTLFTNVPGGLASGIVGSAGYWLGQHEVARGGHPWSYYPVLAALYEFLPVSLGLAAAVAVARGRAPTFVSFCAWWAGASWLAYTLAGEKMPWLLMHPVLPLCLLGGWCTARLGARVDWRAIPLHAGLVAGACPAILVCLAMVTLLIEPFAGRDVRAQLATLRWLVAVGTIAALAMLIVRHARTLGAARAVRLATIGMIALAAILTVRVAARLTYVNYDLATEPLVYAHGTPDIKRAIAEIQLIAERTGRGEDLEVAYDDASTWPFAWYLRDQRGARYYGATPTPDAMAAPVILVGPKNAAKVRPFVEGGYLSRQYRLIWWPEHGFSSLTWTRVKAVMVDPDARHRLWQIIHYRNYPGTSLAEWPNLQPFTMYIRRDVARDVWSLGVDPTLVAGPAAPSAPLRALTISPRVVHAGTYAGKPLRGPTAVAVAADGALVVADSGNDRVVVLDADGGLRFVLGGSCAVSGGPGGGCVDPDGDGPLETGDGQLREPWGLALGPRGEIYVADTWNGRIQVFDGTGRFLRKWGRLGRNPSVDPAHDPTLLYGPRGIAVSPAGALVVADTGNRRLLSFGDRGQPLGQVGGAGAGAGRFMEPVGVATDPRDGSVYVADAWNRRVQRLDRQLRPAAEWAVPGWRGRGALEKPYLAVDSAGRIHVSEPEHARIVIHAPDGRAEASVPLSGEVAARPLGVAIDPRDDALVVADHANNAVLVFPAYRP